MQHPVEIENIEEMRLQEGIDDVELREEIRSLRAGDFVKLTFLTEANSLARETLLVRITSIRGDAFRGKLAHRPVSSGLSELRLGSTVVFTRTHIHSLSKGQPAHER
jgi:hypothetical protein